MRRIADTDGDRIDLGLVLLNPRVIAEDSFAAVVLAQTRQIAHNIPENRVRGLCAVDIPDQPCNFPGKTTSADDRHALDGMVHSPHLFAPLLSLPINTGMVTCPANEMPSRCQT